MDIVALLALVAQYPVVALILAGIGMLVVIGLGVVAITPSKEDDKWADSIMAKPLIGPLLRALASFSPIQKK